MGVYANGHLLYGFIHDDDTEELFQVVAGENEEGYAFEELHQDLQAKHHVSLFQIGGVDIISVFSANASAKGFDDQIIDTSDLTKTEEYTRNITAFLSELGIDTSRYTPKWHLLGYMD